MSAIPPITHQIWFQGQDQLPAKQHENVRLLRELNPTWEHRFWDEKSLRTECASLGPEQVAKFDSFPHLIQKVDFGRQVVLQNQGGVSVDTDMKSLLPIEKTPYYVLADFIVSRTPFPANFVGQVNNAIFLVRPQHEVLREIIDGIIQTPSNENNYATKELFINHTTGPLFIQTILNKHTDKIVVLDHKFQEPCFSQDPQCEPKPELIMEHQHELSWVSRFWKTVLRALFYVLHSAWIFAVLVVLVALAFFKPRWFSKDIRN